MPVSLDFFESLIYESLLQRYPRALEHKFTALQPALQGTLDG